MTGKDMKEVKESGDGRYLSWSNHLIGCEIESISDVLRYRGHVKESDELDKIASRIK